MSCSKIWNLFRFLSFFICCSVNAQAYQVLGIGAPCIDYLINVDQNYVLAGARGGSQLMNWKEIEGMVHSFHGQGVIMTAGGSCANTIRGLANLGEECAFFGKMGSDDWGRQFVGNLRKQHIIPLCLASETCRTQVCLCVITEDGDRTMRCDPGASVEITADDLYPELFQDVSLLHLEGYSLYVKDPQFVPTVMKMAKEAGVLIAFDLGSFELVNLMKDRIMDLLKNYVDIVFANADEVKALTGKNPEEGCKILKDLCSIAVIMMGKDGCLVGSGSEIYYCPGNPVVAKDTTGAGDLFASGFLHGFLNHLPLDMCGYYGNLIGAAVVEVYGAQIPSNKWKELHKILNPDIDPILKRISSR
jgi:sugar/nucleoside kinase (ribokinase family)